MKITIISESKAKVHVIENAVVREYRGKKTEGSQNMRVGPEELLKNKGEKTDILAYPDELMKTKELSFYPDELLKTG